MNIAKLKAAENKFFEIYPAGFDDPELHKIAKKHKLPARTEFCQTNFSTDKFNDPVMIVENMIKIISRSSLVSVFEKPKFKEFAGKLDFEEKLFLSEALFQLLHADQKHGFEQMIELLSKQKLAKWTLLTVIPAYFKPDYEVFVKPTTAKNILKKFEIEDIKYKPLPSYDFYAKFRDYINRMKSYVNSSLCESNPGFTGFLMMTI